MGGGGGGGGESGDGVRLEFSRGFGEDVIVAQTVIMVDELTRFYLREESCSLHWPPPVSLVRHMCSWGNGLIQCLGYGTGDLSQSSEPMWRHKLPLKDLRLGSPSVSFFFCKRQKIKILLYFSTMLLGASVLLTREYQTFSFLMCYYPLLRPGCCLKKIHYLVCPSAVAERSHFTV